MTCIMGGFSIFIDLKKASKTIDFDLLCIEIEQYGIQQRALFRFQSYLYNRRQYYRVEDVDS